MTVTGLTEYNETLLFSSVSGVSAVTLPENKSNFERLKFELGIGAGSGMNTDGYEYSEYPTNMDIIHLNYHFGGGSNEYWAGTYGTWTNDNHLEITKAKSIYGAYNTTGIGGNTGYSNNARKCIWKVWGINRKA